MEVREKCFVCVFVKHLYERRVFVFLNVREEFFVCVCVKCLYECERRVFCVCMCEVSILM